MTPDELRSRDVKMARELIDGKRREAVAAKYGISLSQLDRRVGKKIREHRATVTA